MKFGERPIIVRYLKQRYISTRVCRHWGIDNQGRRWTWTTTDYEPIERDGFIESGGQRNNYDYLPFTLLPEDDQRDDSV